jgi:demethylmenaquinone methyltransferase / 2-methoxy-6-polyprenyl-1,4-benzoquinol methylase
MFDSISNTYDFANHLLSLGFDSRWRRQLARHLPLGKDLSYLDLATGTGAQIFALLDKNAPIQKAVGIDLSDKMLQIARSKIFKNQFCCSIEFKKSDARKLPFQDETFHLCTCSFGIRNIENPLASLSEMFRVTKPNGRCLILEFSRPVHSFRWLIQFYLRHLMPKIGGWIAKNQLPYRYLNQSIEKFALKEDFLSWMRQTGWSNVSAINLFLGLVTIYRGDKLRALRPWFIKKRLENELSKK